MLTARGVASAGAPQLLHDSNRRRPGPARPAGPAAWGIGRPASPAGRLAASTRGGDGPAAGADVWKSVKRAQQPPESPEGRGASPPSGASGRQDGGAPRPQPPQSSARRAKPAGAAPAAPQAAPSKPLSVSRAKETPAPEARAPEAPQQPSGEFAAQELLFQEGRLQTPGSKVIGQIWGPAALLPVGILAAAAAGTLRPEPFLQIPLEWYPLAMGFLSFVIALDFRLGDYLKAAAGAKDLAVGALCQWVVVPILGAAVAAAVIPAMQLPQSLGLGVLMVSFLPASVFSCFATWVAHHNMAPLSVVLATSSMLLCAVCTPLLAAHLPAAVLQGNPSLSSLVIDPRTMAITAAQMLVLPTIAGLILGAIFRPVIRAIKPLLALLALADVCCFTAIVASASTPVLSVSWAAQALIPMVALQLGSMIVSYYIARSALNSIARAKCISLSTGMPAALLGTFLLDRYIKDSVAALGCSLYLPVMLLAGLGMAQWWRPAQP